jgi:Ca-activated chloride channel homolog
VRVVLRITARLIVFVTFSFTLAGVARPQNEDFTFSVDVQLVQLPVSVLDKDGHPVSGLEKDNFQIFEDGVQQEVTFFKHEDIPLSVGLVIDNSGSMHNKRERVNSAALSFAKESNPDDETFIVNFDDAVYLEQDFTSNIADLVAALSHLDTRGQTALYDALYLSADHLNNGKKDKKALLLISDGEDNASKFGLDRVLAKMRESKIIVYAIGLLEPNDERGSFFGKSPSKKDREVLEKFAQTTGGRAYFPKSVDEVGELCRRIARDLRNHYTLGYTPSNRKLDGTWRKIEVRISPARPLSKMTVRTKEGYYSPKADAVSKH